MERLEAILKRAVVLRSCRIPEDVVTINSCIRLLDMDSGNVEEVWLRFTGEKQTSVQSYAVISELGATLLGSRLGDVIEWTAGSGKRRAEIKEIVYQPERFGNYDV